jgi:hypothetical protein
LTQPTNRISVNARNLEKMELFMGDLDEMNDTLPLLMVDTAYENLRNRNRPKDGCDTLWGQ